MSAFRHENDRFYNQTKLTRAEEEKNRNKTYKNHVITDSEALIERYLYY